AAQLQKIGAPLREIAATVLNRRPASALAVWREAFLNVTQESSIVLTTLSKEFLRSVHADDSSTNGLSSWLAGLDGTLISAVLREDEDGSVDVSMRSVPEINVAVVAKKLGGGGHPQAAGCVLPGPLSATRERLLGELCTLTEHAVKTEETVR
ncbi:MAG: DHH family phosphoesterase, partial [Anaerolineae bacterium]